MSNIIATIITVCTLAFGLNATAVEKANPLKDVNTTKLAHTYVEAITSGHVKYNKHLFTTDFEYSNANNGQTNNKTEYLNFLKKNKGLQYDCETTYEILDQTKAIALAKASMKFKNFTRVDYITMIQAEDGWKVNKVVTTYQ